jgi:hypothetical protein
MTSPSVLLKMGNVSEKIVEKIKHAFYIQSLFLLNPAFVNNVQKYNRDRKATNVYMPHANVYTLAFRLCKIYSFSTAKNARTRLNITL